MTELQIKKHKTIEDAMAEMVSTSTKDFDPQNVPVLCTYDLYDFFKSKLTREAREAIESVTIHNLIHERNEDITGIHDFLKFLTKTGNQGVKDDIYLHYNGTYRRVLDNVMFFGKTATLDKLDVAVDRVCRGLNRLAKKNYITGALAPLIGITLQRTSIRQKPKVVIISYVAITHKGEEYAKKMKGLNFNEGGIPPKV